jgi:hypothetical protein
MKPQTKLVANYLAKHRKITPLDALRELGVMRLGARIWELRRQYGLTIARQMKRVQTRDGETRVAEYRLG